MDVVQFIQQNWLLLTIGCLVLLTLFMMMVAAAAILVARLTGQGFLGPLMGPMLRGLSVKSQADEEDIEERARVPEHRHLDVKQISAQHEEDFEEALEKIREQEPTAAPPALSAAAETAAPPPALPVTPITMPLVGTPSTP
ncbi:MAG: hypothetical protein HXY40_11065, partial [Chloroflexi bacterium]|nr:hypothetical protein [Chloroflexota bacterium]